MTLYLVMVAVLVSLTTATLALADDGERTATASIVDARGEAIGIATLRQEEGEEDVLVRIAVSGLPEGKHGAHVHAVGKCEVGPTPPFGSAGPHFDTDGHRHGTRNPQGPHRGDLKNLLSHSDGNGYLRQETNLISLEPEEEEEDSLFDEDGSAVIIHAQRDDLRTDPTGNSGARVACGVITLEE